MHVAIEELCAAGLFSEVGQLPEPVYRFRHGLIQDATYKGLLRAERRQLHARAAWGLEAASPGRLAEVAAVLGYHYAKAGEMERAVHHLEVAGDHASAHFANVEAIALTGTRSKSLTSTQAAPQWPKRRWNFEQNRQGCGYAQGRMTRQEKFCSRPLILWDEVRPWRLLGCTPSLVAPRSLTTAMMQPLPRSRPQTTSSGAIPRTMTTPPPSCGSRSRWTTGRPFFIGKTSRSGLPRCLSGHVRLSSPEEPRRETSLLHQPRAQRSRRSRYRIDDEILTNARAALAVAKHELPEDTIAGAEFSLGHFLLWYGDLPEAQEHIEERRPPIVSATPSCGRDACPISLLSLSAGTTWKR